MTRRPRIALSMATSTLLVVLLAAASMADDGRDPGATPGPAVPAADVAGPAETGPDRDDPNAAPTTVPAADPPFAGNAGRAPDAVPGPAADAPEAGSVTLVFEDAPLRLIKWQVKDAQGNDVDVALLEPKFGVEVDDDLFSLIDPALEYPGESGE